MPQLKNYREVGIFDLMSAPLNPIGAFDAEQFKKDVRDLLTEKPDEKYLAVDLTGLDFVYSDAYNAFIQFQQEMDDRKGIFAVLTSNQTILIGLKKAGLDKTIMVFAYEEDMMSFSLQAQSPAASAEPDVIEVTHDEPAPVASQNMGSTMGSIEGLRLTWIAVPVSTAGSPRASMQLPKKKLRKIPRRRASMFRSMTNRLRQRLCLSLPCSCWLL